MNKKYQFTLTRNYVSDWGYIEAIRELLQNAYDYGDENISFSGDSISICNKNDKLDIKTLLLGYGTKSENRDLVGGFGEGFLLALLVLLRDGYDVSIINSDEIWTPFFEYSEEFKEDLLMVEVSSNPNPINDLNININGLSSYQLDNIKETFLGLDNNYKSIQTAYGEILLDPSQKGKMYVEGLPITSDNNFDYGYNFKAKYVKLDRDRKDINTYELKRITSLALLYMQDYDFDLIDDLIMSGGYDANYIINDNVTLPDDFTYGYSDYLKNKYKISDKSVITTKTDDKVIEELERLGEDVVKVDKKVQADVINSTNTYSFSKLAEVKNTIRNRDKVDEAWNEYEWSDYKNLRDWYNSIEKDNPSDEELARRFREGKEAFFEILESLEPCGFGYIKDQIV